MIEPLLVAKAQERELRLLPALANRHGLVTGATGTGKTVTLQRLAEGFSQIGVPVFLADVKGDLSGIAAPGGASPRVRERLALLGLGEPRWEGCPAVFFDVHGARGHPVRATVSDVGPLLLGRLLDLNETQQGVLAVAFEIADDEGLLLLDVKDLRSMLQFVGEGAARVRTEYGNVSAASIGAIQRGLVELERQGAEAFFGEPALDVEDLMGAENGRGVVSVLAAERLMESPKLYSTLLLWLLAELFERLPEVGDAERPKLVLFFDEAHLLFDGAPKALVEKVEQVVRLIRSKGVGVYFVTQSPLDLPESVLGQLGNRVHHALRAFTPRDQRAVRAVAETLRPNPRLDAERALTELAVGEALVSLLDEAGRPSVVERAFVVPPASRIGELAPEERRRIVEDSPLAARYERELDRVSAYERLEAQAGEGGGAARAGGEGAGRAAGRGSPAEGGGDALRDVLLGRTGPRGGRREGLLEALAKSAARSVGSQLGRAIARGALGSILRGGRR